MLVLVLIFLIAIPAQNDPGETTDWKEISSGIDTWYITLMVCFMITSTAVAVHVYKRYNINYPFIFEIDPHHKLLHHQLYKVALLFFFVWCFCLVS